jgi:UV DNA damage endonuclease
MAKRKRSTTTSLAAVPQWAAATTVPSSEDSGLVQRSSRRKPSQPKPAHIDANPQTNHDVLDGQEALRASPDAEGDSEKFSGDKLIDIRATKADKAKPTTTSRLVERNATSGSSLSELSDVPESPARQCKSRQSAAKAPLSFLDPEADADDLDADPVELSAALSRPPPVNSSYLPLPWKGRLGYACLNTYLRNATPPVFSSRTCRIASILENRHPLKDPNQPAHATKNRPDKDQIADVKRGQAFVEGLGLANAQDIPKMLRWNDKYGIKFLRLSSEMFPFASHDSYGYKLAPFASDALAEAGRVAAELGHRLTTHPGQFTQLGSPRKEVIDASIRDLKYHAELLSLLKLPDQLNRDAVMILHMGGVFGDKAATLDRFRKNYARLDQNIKNRLVLENDDVCYSVHDLLPICEELKIPLVLDFHHHNIIFDQDKIREGTHDIIDLYPRIKATWTHKGITQKMHYSEPTPGAVTGRQRRKHNPRVTTLPPCAPDMDLMIEAKDKEQAVFELMRTFKLPGFDTFTDITPYTRNDENRPWKLPQAAKKKKAPKKTKSVSETADAAEEEENEPPALQPPPILPAHEIAMGGPQGRVYWPPGMEEWLRPKKRVITPKSQKDPTATSTPKKRATTTTPKTKASKPNIKDEAALGSSPAAPKLKNEGRPAAKKPRKAAAAARSVPTPSTSALDDDDSDIDKPASERRRAVVSTDTTTAAAMPRRQSGRRVVKRPRRRTYAEVGEGDEEEEEDDGVE